MPIPIWPIGSPTSFVHSPQLILPTEEPALARLPTSPSRRARSCDSRGHDLRADRTTKTGQDGVMPPSIEIRDWYQCDQSRLEESHPKTTLTPKAKNSNSRPSEYS